MTYHCSVYSLSMPKHISNTKKIICDPALRCRAVEPGDDKDHKTKRLAYENSSVELPSIWSWKTLRGMTDSFNVYTAAPKSHLVDSMNNAPYFPFCQELYEFATGEAKCNWVHCIDEQIKSTDYTYNFPCGCANPTITYTSLAAYPVKPSSAVMFDRKITRLVEIPRCPVFAQGAVVKKRKRKKSKLSLTDNRSYSRKVRERNQKTPKTAKGCSKQMLDEDEPTDSE